MSKPQQEIAFDPSDEKDADAYRLARKAGLIHGGSGVIATVRAVEEARKQQAKEEPLS